MKLKTLGNIPIDMELYKLYIQYEGCGEHQLQNIEEIFNFWMKHILITKTDYVINPKSLGKECEFIEIYCKMLVNILLDFCLFTPGSDNSTAVLKYQWVSRSYQHDKFFKYVVDILITDMKSNLFRKILITQKTCEFEKLIESRFYMLSHTDIFDNSIYDLDYIDYFFSKDSIWQKNNLENRNHFEKIEQKLLEQLK